LDPSHRSPVQAPGALGRTKAAANFRPSLANLVRARTKRAVVTLEARRTEAIQATTKVEIPEMMVIVNLDHHPARNNARRNLGSAREVIDHSLLMVGGGYERCCELMSPKWKIDTCSRKVGLSLNIYVITKIVP
jgi:hypothetical protein